MPLIPDDKIAEIRDRLDIVQVIGETVALRRSGTNFVGLCPFHGERTPSFNVSAAKQFFHCFGCGKSGDVIKFVMEQSGAPFMEVIKDLARKAGVDLPEPERTPAAREAQKRNETERSRILRANQLACDFFRAEYAGPSGQRARRYVEEKRNIGATVRDAFLIGYSPAGWDGLVRFFESKRVPHEVAVAAGLIRPREGQRPAPGAPPTKATHFDLFRDRVMFPLVNPQGEVIAFSARMLEQDNPSESEKAEAARTPKYINSPETLVYKKGEQLYGLHTARAAIRKTGRAILVEGNFDVLMMHERGFTETVAPMGTALTSVQVHLLHRAGPQRVFMFLDGDKAGRRAAARNVGLFLDEDVLCFATLLPDGEDPDTFVAKQGNDALEVLLKHSVEAVEYFCDYAWKAAGDSLMERARLLEDEAAPLLRKVKNGVAMQRFAEKLAYTLDLPLDNVRRTMRAAPNSPSRVVATQPATAPVAEAAGGVAVAAPPQKLDAVDVELIALLADHPQLLQRLRAVMPIIGSEALREALREMAERTESGKLDASALADAVHPSLRQQVMTAALAGSYAEVQSPERALDGIAQRREGERARVELQEKLAAVRSAKDPLVIQKLNARINELKVKYPDLRRGHTQVRG